MVIVYTGTTALTWLSLQNYLQEGEKLTNYLLLGSLSLLCLTDTYKNLQNL